MLLSCQFKRNFFQAPDFSYLVVVNNDQDGQCDRIHGTFKITGVGTYAIENCGECNCALVLKEIDDNAIHTQYDAEGIITNDSQLPIEVLSSVLNHELPKIFQ